MISLMESSLTRWLFLLTRTELAQYQCGTAFYFLSVLALKENITVNRMVGAPGHGKS